MSTNKTILFANDDADLLSIFELRCKKLGLTVIAVDNSVDAIAAAVEYEPQLICLDLDLPGGDCLDAAQLLIKNERFASTPIVIVSASSDPQVHKRCRELPAHCVAKSPDTWNQLESLLCKLIDLPQQRENDAPSENITVKQEPATLQNAASKISRVESAHTPESILDSVFAILDQERVIDDLIPDPKPWVLCVDDDHEFLASLRYRFDAKGIGVINAYDGLSGVQTAFSQPANAILLDYNMPNGQGDFVLKQLKQSPLTKDIPVVILTGNKDDAVRRTLMTLGADAFIYKPPVFEQLLSELERFIEVPA